MQIIKEAVNKGQMMLFVGVIYISDNYKHIQECEAIRRKEAITCLNVLND